MQPLVSYLPISDPSLGGTEPFESTSHRSRGSLLGVRSLDKWVPHHSLLCDLRDTVQTLAQRGDNKAHSTGLP